MTTPTYFIAMLRSLLTALLLTLTACGGGVETGGTGAGAYVQGPISGFGSIIVSGVRFDDDCTPCIVDADNAPFARENLRLGMLVEVESGPISEDGGGGRVATATRVRLSSELLGPVGIVDLANARIGVLGQVVRLTPATVVDGVSGGALALATDDIVEVYGFFDPNGGYVATRIERRASMPPYYRIRGAVRNLDVVALTLRIGLQLFDLTTTGVPAGLTQEDGQFVRLRLRTRHDGGRWPVVDAAVESRSAGDRDDVEAEVEGLISEFTSERQFSVNGVRVDARNAVKPPGLGVGVRVKVRGRSLAGAVIAATVNIRSDDDAFDEGVDVRDVISAVSSTSQTFTLRGITVFYGLVPPDRFTNGTAADLAIDRSVRVRGVLSADRTRVVATRIELINN